MVYDWEAHRETCYRLYIDEGRSLEDIMIWMKAQHKFAPSKRAYQTQFRRWAFPTKRRPAHTDAALVERVETLWQRSLSQREMHRILVEEDGLDITSRDLVRLRARNGWLLRTPKRQGAGGDDVGEDDVDEDMTEDDHDHDADSEPAGGGSRPSNLISTTTSLGQSSRHGRASGPDTSPRPARSPARFPSEMTLDSARRLLGLSPETYRAVRAAFQQTCADANITKKSITSRESWSAAKTSLVARIPHLDRVFSRAHEHADHPNTTSLALDVICTDVAKRARLSGARMTLADARRVLGWDPETSRREALKLKQALKRDGLGPAESLDSVVARWEVISTTVVAALAPDNVHRDHREDGSSDRKKALKVIAKDVMKRAKEGDGAREARRRRAAGLHGPDLARPPSPAPSCPCSSPLQSSPAPLPGPQRRETIAIPPFHDAIADVLPGPPSSSPSAAPHEHEISMTIGLGYNLGTPDDDSAIQGSDDFMPDTMVPTQPPSVLSSSSSSDTHAQHPPPSLLHHHHHHHHEHQHQQHQHLQRQHQQPFMPHQYQHHSSPQPFHHDQAQIHTHGPQPSLLSQTQSHHAQQHSQPFLSLPEPLPFPIPAYINIQLPPPPTHAPPAIIPFITPILSTSVHELCAPILSQYPGTACQRIDGVLRMPAMAVSVGADGDPHARELTIMILTDAMLEAYLRHMRNSPPSLNIVLAWKE